MQFAVTVEAVIYRRDASSPHEDDDAKIVELIAEECIRRAVVPNDVAPYIYLLLIMLAFPT